MPVRRIAGVAAAAVLAASCGEERRSPSGPSGAPTPVALIIAASAPSIGVGESQQLRASITYSDGTGAPPTGDITWTTSNETVYTLWPGGLAVAAGPGAATITASAAGLTGVTTLTVEARAGGLRRVHGRAVDLTSSTGIANATLAFGQSSSTWSTVADGGGSYAIDLPPGWTSVAVNGQHMGFLWVRVGGPAFRGDVYGNVGPCLGRYGLVTDAATYRPIAGAAVRYGGGTSVTGPDGWYRIDHACVGHVSGNTITVNAEHPDYEYAFNFTGRGLSGFQRSDLEMRRR